jgi:outer membrane protein TolC
MDPMSLTLQRQGILLSAVLALLVGCRPSRPYYFFEDGDLSHYVGVATQLEYPDVETERLAEVEGAQAPLTLANQDVREIWDVSLEDAVRATLHNNKVMRSVGGRVVSGPGQLLGTASDGIQTVYDPARNEAHPLTGVEGALSAFDAQFLTSMTWNRNDQPRNIRADAITGIFFIPTLEQDLGTFQAQLRKRSATGALFSATNNTIYDLNNSPIRGVPSDWTTNFDFAFEQPLLRGAGVNVNRIVGPLDRIRVGQGFNGVVIARINNDIDLANFQATVRNLVNDVETAYWELYFAYRNLEAVKRGRDSALETWKKVYSLFSTGSRGGEAAKEAQAREQYFLFRSQLENAASNLYSSESRLRYLMGLSPTDGRLIRPADEPTSARVTFDWSEIHAEALVRSEDLRAQKWLVKRRELELVASRNFLLPTLNAVGRYRFLGLGDDLAKANGNGIDPAFPSLTGTDAFATMFDGRFQEWELGLRMEMPIGFRAELSLVRHQQLQLSRERAILEDKELDLSHALSDAVRELDRAYELTETNFDRATAAAHQVNAVQQAFDAGTETLDILLDSQRRLADAESAYFRSLVDYNRAIAFVHFRKGSLLDYDGVMLSEGPWPGKAYFDANKRARERDGALFIDYGFTRPEVFSRGPIPQGPPGEMLGEGDVIEGIPTPAVPNDTLEPTPADGQSTGDTIQAREPGAPLFGTAGVQASGSQPHAPEGAVRRASWTPTAADGQGIQQAGGEPASAPWPGPTQSPWRPARGEIRRLPPTR